MNHKERLEQIARQLAGIEESDLNESEVKICQWLTKDGFLVKVKKDWGIEYEVTKDTLTKST